MSRIMSPSIIRCASQAYCASSTQSAGFLSSGSSISLGGFTLGVKSSRRLPFVASTSLMRMEKVLSGCTTSVYKFVLVSPTTAGGLRRCFSSYSPVLLLRWRKIKWT